MDRYPAAPYAHQAQGTNGLAIAAMVCSIFGFLYLIPAVVGVVLAVEAGNSSY